MPLDAQLGKAGLLIPLLVKAGGRRNEVGGIHDGRLRVSVTQVPEQGRANQAIIELMSSTLRIPQARLQIVSGSRSNRKVLCLHGMSLDEFRQRYPRFFDGSDAVVLGE